MTDRMTAVPDGIRRAARSHGETAEELSAATACHAAVLSVLESLGPVFAGLRESGWALLDQRLDCYRQQAAVHADLAAKLAGAVAVWEQHEADSAHGLAAGTAGPPGEEGR